MVRAPHALEFRSALGGELLFEGPTSRLVIRRLFHGAYQVRYDFSAYPVSEDLDEASSLLYDPEFCPESSNWSVGNPEDGVLRTEDGGISLGITLADGVVEIRRGKVAIHGGRIGSSDTVLPRYPLRVHGSVPGNVRGKFNFRLEDEDRFFGLGDKGGDPDRRGRRFLMHNQDALGYCGAFSDPLYKSIPFVIKWNPATDVWMGLVILATDVTAADFGAESPYYYSFSLENGPFRYAVVVGEDYREILEKYTRLTGRPAFPPAFSFGFLGSSMDYTEPDDAVSRVKAYLDAVEENDVPCEGIYLSSGYCKAEDGKRYAFEWNHRKFPDPVAFLGSIRSRGYHVAANIKPGILVTHPGYREYAGKGYFVSDTLGDPYLEYYWGADASFWDFANPSAGAEWKRLLNDRLIDHGFDGIWNDNNEIEIEDATVPAHSQRSTFALRMSRISYEALLERNPGRRPWVISRSGGIGIQRYARTWSGDNTSNWESLRANNLMGQSMGLSGLPYFGHDIGGFLGSHPDSELFLRWCQSAVFQPRFVIHSWNDDGRPTELWNYSDIRDSLRDLVYQHYEFMPTIYTEAYRAHRTGLPMHRSVLLEFPDDAERRSDEDLYLFGENILVVLALRPDTAAVVVKLPPGTDWYDPIHGVLHSGGAAVRVDIVENRTRYLVRTGGVVSRAPGAKSLDTGWFSPLHFDIVPGPVEIRRLHFEDDGISMLEHRNWSSFTISVRPLGAAGWTVRVERTDANHWSAPGEQRRFVLNLPEGFEFVESGKVLLSNSFRPPAPGRSLQFVVKGKYRRSGDRG